MDLVVNFFADEQAGVVPVTCTGGHVGGSVGARHAADAGAHAGVLEVSSGWAAGTHAAHTLLLGVHDHLFQPAPGDDLGVAAADTYRRVPGPEKLFGAVVESLALPGKDLEVVAVVFPHPLIAARTSAPPLECLEDEDLES
ncbi:MAG: hypothetical protein V8T12_01470, partial [Parabacteroides johnsonii]